MADLYKTVGSERIKLTDEEVAQYEKDTKELGISDTDRKKSKFSL